MNRFDLSGRVRAVLMASYNDAASASEGRVVVIDVSCDKIDSLENNERVGARAY